MAHQTILNTLLMAGVAFTTACTPLQTTRMHDGPDAVVTGTVDPASAVDERTPGGMPDTHDPGGIEATDIPRWSENPPLSPGDRLQIHIVDGEGFNGRYELGMDGTLQLPHLPALAVAGGDARHAEAQIRTALVAADLFKPHRVRVSVRVHEWSHVQVHVSGAVFDPGMVTINVRNPEERALKDNLASGDFPSERMLAAALRAAGGIRPDAAVDQIRLIRNGRLRQLDYSGLLQGRRTLQVPLMSGDTIVVPGSGSYDAALVAPSAITPPGIRVFLSNLTVPAAGNALSAISKQSSSLPYGSRLLTATFSANCVGGVNSTNAARHVLLVRTNPLSGQQETIEQPISALLQAPYRHDLNPLLMPNDSIACYDSGVTSLRDIARTLADILLPFTLL